MKEWVRLLRLLHHLVGRQRSPAHASEHAPVRGPGRSPVGLIHRFPGKTLEWLNEDNLPQRPNLKTPAQIEALPKYTACPLCTPDLAHVNKPQRAITWTYIPAASLKSKHFGTEFRLANGTRLGALTRITTEETIDELAFKAEFD
jgi:hypothetical protein